MGQYLEGKVGLAMGPSLGAGSAIAVGLAKRVASLVSLGMAAVLCMWLQAGTSAWAQTPSTQASTGELELQRSTRRYNFTLAAQSGSQRGEEIYFYECWTCHNDYTIKEGIPAPSLEGIFQRPRMMNGQPVSEETVAEYTLEGGPLMPGFRHTLTDADIADLMSYFRDEKCCFTGNELPPNPWYRASSGARMVFQGRDNLAGGPLGEVQSAAGYPLEGVGVQLIAQENAVRTTVYSNEEGQYEFPKLPMGVYTLRIARPLEFKPYRKDSVRIDGATQLEGIVLEPVVDSDLLPPTPEILSQLVGAEWLMNLSGTGQEKRVFANSCGGGCHSYQEVFRTRFDESGWRNIVERMNNYVSAPLIVPRRKLTDTPDNESLSRSGMMLMSEENDILVKWLTRVRGPESKDMPLVVLPGPRGAATRVIITEYELPRLLISPHDMAGDSKGNIWYTSHRSPYIGKLDPDTGVITEYMVPITPGALPGTHRVWIDKNDILWLSEAWSKKLTSFDPRTEKFTQVKVDSRRPFNTGFLANFGLAPDGYVWLQDNGELLKIDPGTGEKVKRFPLKKIHHTYGNLISWDGNFWSGGQHGGVNNNMVGMVDLRTGESLEVKTRTRVANAAKGYFDPEGNAWFGARGGMLIKLDAKKQRTKEYFAPTPYVTYYEAMVDKNGEVWAGELHGGRILRLNPRTEQMIEYVLPEPYSHNRKTWIDNSTDPVTVWYVDHNGYIVRIQPMD